MALKYTFSEDMDFMRKYSSTYKKERVYINNSDPACRWFKSLILWHSCNRTFDPDDIPTGGTSAKKFIFFYEEDNFNPAEPATWIRCQPGFYITLPKEDFEYACDTLTDSLFKQKITDQDLYDINKCLGNLATNVRMSYYESKGSYEHEEASMQIKLSPADLYNVWMRFAEELESDGIDTHAYRNKEEKWDSVWN